MWVVPFDNVLHTAAISIVYQNIEDKAGACKYKVPGTHTYFCLVFSPVRLYFPIFQVHLPHPYEVSGVFRRNIFPYLSSRILVRFSKSTLSIKREKKKNSSGSTDFTYFVPFQPTSARPRARARFYFFFFFPWRFCPPMLIGKKKKRASSART